LVLVPLLFAACAAAPEDTHQVEKHLQHEYLKKNWIIRNFYGSRELRFDSSGNLVKGGRPESWTLAGVKITSLKIRDGELEISGRRFCYVYDSQQQRFTLQERPDSESVRIRAPVPSGLDEAGAQHILNSILTTESQDLPAQVPEYWREFLMHPGPEKESLPGSVVATLNTGEPVYRTGGGVERPRPISTPDPEYVEAARMARVQGTVVLSLVVDKTGHTRNVRIVRPLGWGLDDRAAETLSHWQLAPAVRNGEPVAVRLDVEVSFRLY